VSTLVTADLAQELHGLGAFDASACMNCGFCTAVCPLGVDLLPRRLFRYVLLGMEERVRSEHGPIFSCLLCRSCEENCPSGVHITENVHQLRRWLLKEGH
jgi:heterodisulfide reductase subunit C